ncbi:membrane protein insertion efficiency factor YidD [Candidatus Parcubacteria bacterium]|nr:membrane protein insertion efficiency factor YidD [Patescibacteria group bacterium]MBU4381244.1 membrane protein insertion efficiency factor YidD [Patescibacteria group bacterium]MCG2689276.1 membrane protein insertion efficiency factor YidD [Candidatus Parcubacteria bacterium]
MKKLVILLIRLYQKLLSFETGVLSIIFPQKICRFTPSCSQYTIDAITKYGILHGGIKGVRRILRCNPHNVGGSDPA